MTVANRVYDTGARAVFGIAFNNATLEGVDAKKPFQVALCISAEIPDELKATLEISDGDVESGNGVDLHLVGRHDFGDTIDGIMSLPSTGRKAEVDLHFFQGVMQHRSEEEERGGYYTFGEEHANDLRHVYASWIAQVLAKNCNFSASVVVETDDCSVLATLYIQQRETGKSHRFIFHSSFSGDEEEVLLQTIFGLPPAA